MPVAVPSIINAMALINMSIKPKQANLHVHPKPVDTVQELIILQQELRATRELVDTTLKALSERIEKLIPEIPVKQRVTDWKGEVKSWPSWRKNLKN